MSTVVVTGGTRGIGRALVERCRLRGDRTISTGRRAGPDPDDIALDVTDPAAFAVLDGHLRDAPVDLLIANAGVYPDGAERLDDGYPAAMWAEVMATNVTGVFLTVQALLPRLRAARAAKIAIISSQLGSHTRASGGSYIYRASKAAVLNLGRNLASDLAEEGIAVGIYHPGWVRTDMGGDGADIDVDEAANGLLHRVRDLSLATSGCFETWDGRPHPF